jgi:NhaP-type Na+/H+ or K+/H+ antiporter
MINILTLAGPGVLWGAIIIAACFKWILAYSDDDLTWYQALTLGCVLSATDPVAVVALLK